MDPSKVSAVLDWEQPTDLKGLQRFLGFANFYRRFIRNFSTRVAPLTDLTKKGAFSAHWPDPAVQAFSELKKAFSSAPVLIHPDVQHPFIVEVDASELGVGAILSQYSGNPERLHPCAFFSRKFSPAEKNYDIGNRELLAVKLAFEEWRHWLEGALHTITVFTDHKNLEYIESAKRLNSRQARWSLFFSRFRFSITFKPGAKNIKADALSRSFLGAEPGEDGQEPILPPGCVVAALLPDLAVELGQYQAESPPGKPGNCLFVPLHLRLPTLQQFHDAKSAGHLGVKKTMALVSRHVWWPSFNKDVEAYVKACTTCARSKTPRSSPAGLLMPLPVPSCPWTHISMDFITDLPKSRGHSVIWVVVDRFSKMAHFIPLPKLPSAKELAQLFVDHIFRLHGLPENVVSDRGVQFISRFWQGFCSRLGISVSLSSAYHPQSNGQTERTNQSLEQFLRCFVSDCQNDWIEFLSFAEFAFNNAPSSSSGYAPFHCVYGRDLRGASLPGPPSELPALEDWLSSRKDLWSQIHSNLVAASDRQKRFADRHRTNEPCFNIGDLVWVSTKNLALRQPSPKLGPRFIGPFPVLKRVNQVTYKVELPPSMKIPNAFHVSLLKSAADTDTRSPPPASLVEGQPEYEVSRILDSRLVQNSLQYLVDWKGYGPEERSWVPARNVHADRLVRRFHQENPERPCLKGPVAPLQGGG